MSQRSWLLLKWFMQWKCFSLPCALSSLHEVEDPKFLECSQTLPNLIGRVSRRLRSNQDFQSAKSHTPTSFHCQRSSFQVTTKGFAANFCSPCLEYRNTICCEFISGHFHLSLEPQQLWKEHPARSPCHTFSWSCHVLRPYLHGSALLHRHQVQHHLVEHTGKKPTQNSKHSSSIIDC